MNSTARVESFAYLSEKQSTPGWAPLLAGLPHLCMGAYISLNLYTRSFIPGHKTLPLAHPIQLIVLLFLVASLVIVYYARRHGQPMWTAAWDGYAIFIATAVIATLLAALDEDSFTFQAGFTFLGLLAILIGYFLRFRYAPRHAMLMGILLLPFTALIFLDTVPLLHQAVFVLGLYLLYALLSAWVVVSPGWASAAWLAFAAGLLAAFVQGVFFVAFSAAPAISSELRSESVTVFIIQAALLSAFYFAPWVAWRIRDLFLREAP